MAPQKRATLGDFRAVDVTETLSALLQALIDLVVGSASMSLDSARFAAFFVAVLAASVLLGRLPLARTGLLVVANVLFFAHFSGWWVLLLLAVGLLDWAVGQRIADPSRPRARLAWLLLSLTVNLGLLATFKYLHFVVGSFDALTGGHAAEGLGRLVVPVGLSFTTFRTLSYILDLYLERIDSPERHPLRYLAYVSFFPTLLAGPISRAAEVLPRLSAPYALTREQSGRAVWLFTKGLVKKVVIADVLAQHFVNRVFDSPGAFTGLENLLAAIAYGFQLYADFSGYTDMVLACALALGFELKGNFLRPFQARSVGEFWRRWHITLSQWFNDYVFVPLSMTWRGAGRWGAVAAVIVTFVLSGLWHGAGWTFVLWGLSHGLAIGLETALLPLRQRLNRNLAGWYYHTLSTALCFAFLTATFVLFRSATLESAQQMFAQIAAGVDLSLLPQWAVLYRTAAITLGAAVVLHALPQGVSTWAERRVVALPWWAQSLVLALVALATYQWRSAEGQPFIYLQF